MRSEVKILACHHLKNNLTHYLQSEFFFFFLLILCSVADFVFFFLNFSEVLIMQFFHS